MQRLTTDSRGVNPRRGRPGAMSPTHQISRKRQRSPQETTGRHRAGLEDPGASDKRRGPVTPHAAGEHLLDTGSLGRNPGQRGSSASRSTHRGRQKPEASALPGVQGVNARTGLNRWNATAPTLAASAHQGGR
jgi:hypothetical protein